jgi:CTP synthase
MEAGIQPHIIACRATEPCGDSVMQKIAMFSNVPMRRVFSMHDRPSIYTIPDEMRTEGLDREILSILGLHDRVDIKHEDRARANWGTFVNGLTRKKSRSITLGITGKYTGLRDAYASIDKAVEHCTAALGCDAEMKWIETTDITTDNVAERLRGLDGVIVPGGFGARGVEGKIRCVRHCRENNIPYLGICLGFQVAVIEYARNVLGLSDANSSEFQQNCKNPVISELPEQKKIEGLGGSMRLGGQDIDVTPGTLASFLYGVQTPLRPSPKGTSRIRERFRHRYEVDPNYVARLEEAGMIFSGRHPVHPIMQIMELPPVGEPNGHPYFIGGQFHPELTSRPVRPQPLFMGLVAATLRAKYPELGEAGKADATLARWLRPALRQPQAV